MKTFFEKYAKYLSDEAAIALIRAEVDKAEHQEQMGTGDYLKTLACVLTMIEDYFAIKGISPSQYQDGSTHESPDQLSPDMTHAAYIPHHAPYYPHHPYTHVARGSSGRGGSYGGSSTR